MTNNGFAAGCEARLRLAVELELELRAMPLVRAQPEPGAKPQLFRRAAGEAEPRLKSGGEAGGRSMSFVQS